MSDNNPSTSDATPDNGKKNDTPPPSDKKGGKSCCVTRCLRVFKKLCSRLPVFDRLIVIGVIIVVLVFSHSLMNKLFTPPKSRTPALVIGKNITVSEPQSSLDDQFNRLLGTLTLLVTVFGLIIPAGAYLLQRLSLKEERERVLGDLKNVENKIADMQKDTKSELAFQMGVSLFHLAVIFKQKLESNRRQRLSTDPTSSNTSDDLLLVEDAISSCSLFDYCYLAIKAFDDCVKLDRSEKGKAEQQISRCLPLLVYVNAEELVKRYDYMLEPLNERVTELLAIPKRVPDPNLEKIQKALQKALERKRVPITEQSKGDPP